jgi:hypothetical protein
MRYRALVLALLVALTAPVVAPAANLTPLVLGWEQFFKIDWQAGERRNKPVVYGYLKNEWGMPAARIQLLVEGIDAQGAVVGQKVAWFGPTLNPGIRSYYEVGVPWQTPTYRVSVFAFEWVQAPGGETIN